MGNRAKKPNQASKEFAKLNDKGLGIRHDHKPVSVMLPPELDNWVRSLSNRSEWIREAIREKHQREAAAEATQDSEKAS
ncbi:MAG: hypothetical protein BRC39_00830 [Cyanobacteria bacterium QH_7_48_89]|jgi:hypothetical protein|nr:MAG: hypothetical protein BRC39_00830 [Cyanobacteria bacterium QH_7_48_89]